MTSPQAAGPVPWGRVAGTAFLSALAAAFVFQFLYIIEGNDSKEKLGLWMIILALAGGAVATWAAARKAGKAGDLPRLLRLIGASIAGSLSLPLVFRTSADARLFLVHALIYSAVVTAVAGYHYIASGWRSGVAGPSRQE